MENNRFGISELDGPSARFRKSAKVIGSTFMIDERYQIIDTLGSGAYGVVASAKDLKTGEMIAIKKIEKAFEHSTYTKRTLRELKIMRLLDHENIIRIKSIQLPISREEFDEIYVICELMETDLNTIIKSKQLLTDEHCQFFLYQILRGLKYMHSAGIFHRDLKPRNLLVNANCDIKICDFGLARPVINDLRINTGQMTDYVATRWYRAPELLLTYKSYTTAMDVWSVGCIFGEILLRKPLLPGTDAYQQLEVIFNLIGSPSSEDISKIPHARSRDRVMRMAKRPAKDFSSIFPDANPLGLDLLKQLLVFDPAQRITVEQALNHPYLEGLHVPEDEPTTEPVSIFDFEYEREVLTIRDLKDLVYEEILLHHFTAKRNAYYRNKAEYIARHQSTLENAITNDESDVIMT